MEPVPLLKTTSGHKDLLPRQHFLLPGDICDIPAILSLNKKYLLSNLPVTRQNKGFIKIPYSFEQITCIINQNELVVAKNGHVVTGYYLIGSACGTEVLRYQQNIALKFAAQNHVNPARVAYGLQICIDEPFHNNGLFVKLLEVLIKCTNMKYDYFLCSVSDENAISLNAHIKAGWEIIDKTGYTNYLLYKITSHL